MITDCLIDMQSGEAFTTTSMTKTMSSKRVDNNIMTIGEVANYCKLTLRTIYRLAGAKQILDFVVSRIWRFKKTDIDGWTREQSQVSLGSYALEERTWRKHEIMSNLSKR